MKILNIFIKNVDSVAARRFNYQPFQNFCLENVKSFIFGGFLGVFLTLKFSSVSHIRIQKIILW